MGDYKYTHKMTISCYVWLEEHGEVQDNVCGTDSGSMEKDLVV